MKCVCQPSTMVTKAGSAAGSPLDSTASCKIANSDLQASIYGDSVVLDKCTDLGGGKLNVSGLSQSDGKGSLANPKHIKFSKLLAVPASDSAGAAAKTDSLMRATERRMLECSRAGVKASASNSCSAAAATAAITAHSNAQYANDNLKPSCCLWHRCRTVRVCSQNKRRGQSCLSQSLCDGQSLRVSGVFGDKDNQDTSAGGIVNLNSAANIVDASSVSSAIMFYSAQLEAGCGERVSGKAKLEQPCSSLDSLLCCRGECRGDSNDIDGVAGLPSSISGLQASCWTHQGSLQPPSPRPLLPQVANSITL
jgi:hypothetical protein